MTVTLAPSNSSPSPVGTVVTFSALVSDAPSANLWYRFRVRRQGDDYQMIRDYGPISALTWTATRYEGWYEIEAGVRALDTGEESITSTLFEFQSRVTAGQAVVSPTLNSLILLYSAPPCAAHSRMRVVFTRSQSRVQYTPYQNCFPGLSMNFYLAGLRANTAYTAYEMVDSGFAVRTSPAVTFTTGSLPANLYSDTVVTNSPGTLSDHILLGSPIGGSPIANDLSGNVVWYGPGDLSTLTRPETGGFMWGIVEIDGADPSQQVVRKIDLTGMTVLETNAARVNEQLKALGKRQISAFHHEARTLPDGRIAVLGAVEQILTGVQGPGSIDIVGDMIIVLNSDLSVAWTWDAFDHLDVHRAAVLAETCPGACPPMQLAQTGNDWTHGNAVQETAEGNLLYSSRHQDWLIKIAYDNGNGDGHVIWRLGQDGDFRIQSSDSYPWFSHQHDGNFEAADPTKLVVFDDGNTRVYTMQGGNSRGQELQIDEPNRMATPILNVDLGVYSQALGSAQALRNGDFHFDAGFTINSSGAFNAFSFEVDPAGQVRYEAQQNTLLYRTFRMTDMYMPN